MCPLTSSEKRSSPDLKFKLYKALETQSKKKTTFSAYAALVGHQVGTL